MKIVKMFVLSAALFLSGCAHESPPAPGSSQTNLADVSNSPALATKSLRNAVAFAPVIVAGERAGLATESDKQLLSTYASQLFNQAARIDTASVSAAYTDEMNPNIFFKQIYDDYRHLNTAQLDERGALYEDAVFRLGRAINARYVIIPAIVLSASHAGADMTDKNIGIEVYDCQRRLRLTSSETLLTGPHPSQILSEAIRDEMDSNIKYYSALSRQIDGQVTGL